MKHILLLPTLVTLSVASVGHAQTYAGVSIGAAFPEDSRNRGVTSATIPATANFPAIAAGTPVEWRTDLETGFNLSGQLGRRFDNGFRVEAEVAWSRTNVRNHRDLLVGGADVGSANKTILTRGVPSAGGPTVDAVLSSDPGRMYTVGAFGNVFYDFNRSGRLQPYVGAGLGVQHVDVDYRPSGVPVADGRQTRFAYQLMAGATYRLNPDVDLFAQYSWRDTAERAEVRNLLIPATLGVQARQSIASAGLRFGF